MKNLLTLGILAGVGYVAYKAVTGKSPLATPPNANDKGWASMPANAPMPSEAVRATLDSYMARWALQPSLSKRMLVTFRITNGLLERTTTALWLPPVVDLSLASLELNAKSMDALNRGYFERLATDDYGVFKDVPFSSVLTLHEVVIPTT